MRKIYYLSTCSTCQRIMREFNITKDNFVYQDIKNEPITPSQLEEMKNAVGSYEALFSRRAMKYKSMGLKNKTLAENDYKNLILQEYTFLKRPVIVVDGKYFVGSSKKVLADLKKELAG
ncbi:MAG TPA: arsenate reductase [Saprospiraceae bacterium]|nr:arsenate reductase [Saprospiraceae bacterium]